MWTRRISFFVRWSAESRFFLPPLEHVKYTLPSSLCHRGTGVESQAGVEREKGSAEGLEEESGERRGARRALEREEDERRRGGWEEGRKEATWVIKRVHMWEVGRDSQVQSQRTRESAGELPPPLRTIMVNDGILLFYPVLVCTRRPAWKRETGTAGRCTTWRATDFGWKVTSLQM